MTQKSKQKQKVNVRSPEARALTISKRGGTGDRIPSGTAYVRKPKHGAWA